MGVNDFRGRGESKVDPLIEDLAYELIGAALEVHRISGPGLLESTYRKALCRELDLRCIRYRKEDPFDVIYKGVVVGAGRLDLIIEDKLIVELKAVESLHEAHRAQANTYLICKGLPLALLINFSVPFLKDGIRRVVHTGHRPPNQP
jgi:GxxExxY protein